MSPSRQTRGLNPLKDAEIHVKMGKDKDIITGRYINPIKGRGVFAKTPILQGSFILEYRGTLVEKGKLGKINNNNYAYFFKHGGRDCCIDASLDDGSLGRLVNDSQKPNGKIKKIELGGKPHLCLFAIKDINKDDQITYNYGGQDLPWRSYCGQELCKFVHEPVAPAITGSEVTSAKEFVHEPVAPAITGSEVTSAKEFVHEPVAPAITGSEVTSAKEFVHEPVAPAITGSEVTSAKEFVHEPVAPAITGSEVTSAKESL
uniref:SET domain-containing protein n=1 Tax=Cyprinus carpio carpio TaxID=630221 RepID=A0A9J7XHV3_CYPCA